MDLITLAMAKKYSDSKGGYSEPNVFTFDGNAEGMVIRGEYVKISDKTPDVATFVKCRGFIYGQLIEVNAADCKITDHSVGHMIIYGNAAIFLIVNKDGIWYGEAVSSDDFGLYALCNLESNSYVSYAEFAETIHPIDPKYLPGVCLPVVEIADLTAITAEESAKLTAAIGSVCIISVTIEGAFSVGLWEYAYVDNTHIFLALSASMSGATIKSADGVTWTMVMP